MRLHLKAKMVANGVLSVTICVLLSMVIVYFLIREQSQTVALGRIEHAFKVFSTRIESQKKDLVSAAENLARGEVLNNQLALIADLVDIKDDISHTVREMAGLFTDDAFLLGIQEAVIYDVEGKWVSASLIHNNSALLLTPESPGSSGHSRAEMSASAKVTFDDFKKSTEPLPFSPSHPLPMPKESLITLDVLENGLWLRVSAPALSVSEDMKHRGQVVVSVPIDTNFIKRVSGFTGTTANLFLNGNLSAGMIPTYNRLEGKGTNLSLTALRGSGPKGLSRSLSLGGEMYFEGVFPVVEQGQALGMLSILLSKAETQRHIRRMLFWLSGIAVAFCILVIPFALLFARSIATPINAAISGLSEGADHIAEVSQQVSKASQSLAESSTRQAAAIEETASSMEEMSNITKQNASHAGEARAMAEEAGDIVQKVKVSISEMTAAFEDITRSSEETGAIIKTIDDIAFQTNLLALNAAVEAARAGESGAGFAVVADEVRNLAVRAAGAAKSTSSLILDTIEEVNDGNEIMAATQAAFEENIEISIKIGQLIDKISEASREQSTEIEQVNSAIAEMDKAAQANAASSEESAAFSEQASAQALQIKGFVQELVRVIEGVRKSPLLPE